MKKTKPIYAGLIAAVLLASISISAHANHRAAPESWTPGWGFQCKAFQRCR